MSGGAGLVFEAGRGYVFAPPSRVLDSPAHLAQWVYLGVLLTRVSGFVPLSIRGEIQDEYRRDPPAFLSGPVGAAPHRVAIAHRLALLVRSASHAPASLAVEIRGAISQAMNRGVE